jgi:kynurenine formamidase
MFKTELKDLISKGEIYDLAQPWYPGMPHHPMHPPFAYVLTKKHGEVVYEGGGSAANDLFTLGGHTGTHLDAIGHISKEGRLFGGIEAAPEQDYVKGMRKLSIEETPPIIVRGILVDIPKLKGVEVLDKGYPITKKDIQETIELEGIMIKPDDAVLVRTGWALYWHDSALFNNHEGVPGVALDAARFLVEKGIRLTGSDTGAYEALPTKTLEVHVFLIAEKGIQIMEMLNLEELASKEIYSFVLIAIPLKIKGAVGSPIRPIAIR